MELKERIEALVAEYISEDAHFLVDIVISSKKGPSKILILIDGDDGVNIDDCAALSRSVGYQLEEQELLDSKYTLEVSSPGVDYPLKSIRQYKKNVGREVKITLTSGEELIGVLKLIDTDLIVLDKKVKKGKKVTLEEVEIPLQNIKKTIVQISFK
ncbi:MAG: ribosome maturation factor RimP [Bacteroidota bacterium]